MTKLPRRFLHGSSQKNIDRLSASKGWDKCPFGPALYLTEDLAVARCYLGDDGEIYELEVEGNAQYTIALNLDWSHQTVEARMAIQKLLKAAKVRNEWQDAQDARSIISLTSTVMSPRERNDFLRDSGVWMLHGYLDVYENSGLCDRGTQYALLDDSAILRQNVLKMATSTTQAGGRDGE